MSALQTSHALELGSLIEAVPSHTTIEQVKERRIGDCVSQMSDKERTFIEWLLDHGEIDEQDMAKNSPPAEIGRASECGLIRKRRDFRGTFGFNVVFINPDYKDALYRVLHLPPAPNG